MGLRILLIGDDLNFLSSDGEMLRARGFRVYFCSKGQIVNDMVDETKPDVVFINRHTHDEVSTGIYHSFLDNIHYASIPVIYNLSTDDVYLVNRKRTVIKESRYMTSNNVLDAIRMAFITPEDVPARKRVPLLYPSYSGSFAPYRA